MRFKAFSLSLIALILTLALVSASMDLKTVSIPSTQSGKDVTIVFALNNSDDVAHSSLVWTDSTGFKTLPDLSSIASKEYKEVSAVVSIPKTTKLATATLSVKSGTLSSSLPVSINVLDTPSLSISQQVPVTVANGGTINITNNGNINLANINLSSSGNARLTFSANSISLDVGKSVLVNVLVAELIGSSVGNNEIVILARDAGTGIQSSTSFFVSRSFCKSGIKGTNLSITDINIDTSGDADDEWLPLDKLTIEVEVTNEGDSDIKNIGVEMGLFDNSGRNVVRDLDFVNKDEEKIKISRIKDNSDEKVTFEFQVPGDLNEGSYRLAFKAYSKDVGENVICTEETQDSISIVTESDEGRFIAFDNINLAPTDITCGDTVVMDTDVFNIGEDDQDRVRVNIYNKELSLDQTQEIKNFDIGEKKQLTFTFDIPQVVDKSYTLSLDADYDYNDGEYDQSLDDTQTFSIRIFGCSAIPSSTALPVSITASLESEAKAGENMVVSSTIKNQGTQAIVASINAKNYESWASLSSISESTLSLAPGESKQVSLTFNVKTDISGQKSFVLEAKSGDKVQSQEVSADIASSQSGFASLFSGKWMWAIIIVNVVLLILIIIVIVKIAQR